MTNGTSKVTLKLVCSRGEVALWKELRKNVLKAAGCGESYSRTELNQKQLTKQLVLQTLDLVDYDLIDVMDRLLVRVTHRLINGYVTEVPQGQQPEQIER